jgi:hypothetical protein
MTKAKREALERELEILRALNAKDEKPSKAKKTTKRSPKGCLEIVEDVEKTARCADGSGYEYSVVIFDAKSRAEMTDEQTALKDALSAVTWGKNGNGWFRFNNRNFTGKYGWSGRTDKIPAAVLKASK